MPFLTCVTITGADDSTDPEALVELWERFPFVEWGILIGTTFGDRMPSDEWIRKLVECREKTGNVMRLSLHVCGKWLRQIAAGRSQLQQSFGPTLYAFKRVQMNWHGVPMNISVAKNVVHAFSAMDMPRWDPTLIFQLDGTNDDLYKESVSSFRCAGLFDRSHGMGVKPGDWPACHRFIPSGWAGGLGPDNLEAEIPRIAAMANPALDYWIDMETHVRTEADLPRQDKRLSRSYLDLEKTRRCLQIASKFAICPH